MRDREVMFVIMALAWATVLITSVIKFFSMIGMDSSWDDWIACGLSFVVSVLMLIGGVPKWGILKGLSPWHW